VTASHDHSGGAAPSLEEGRAWLNPRAPSRHGPSPIVVGIVGLVIATAAALRILIPHDFDPTIFVTFARDDAPVQRAYPRALLGDVDEAGGFSHDGKFFFAQANDPLYLHPEEHAVVLDQPVYRARRMLFPLIAGGFGLFAPAVIVWSMLVTNILTMAFGAWITAKVAESEGFPTWLGIWFPLNIGLLFEINYGGSGVLAYAFCVAGVYYLLRGSRWMAAFAFAAGALSREVMVVFALGTFVLRWMEERRPPWRLITVPTAVLACWNVYLVARLAGISGAGGDLEYFSAPFIGIVDAFGVWTTDVRHLIVDVLIVGIVVLFVPLALRSRSLLAWGALPFPVMGIVLSANVWLGMFNFTRALAPVFTAIPFLFAEAARTLAPEEAMAGDVPSRAGERSERSRDLDGGGQR
jgi:hypothetical protein